MEMSAEGALLFREDFRYLIGLEAWPIMETDGPFIIQDLLIVPKKIALNSGWKEEYNERLASDGFVYDRSFSPYYVMCLAKNQPWMQEKILKRSRGSIKPDLHLLTIVLHQMGIEFDKERYGVYGDLDDRPNDDW
jgi:hypothetical protein